MAVRVGINGFGRTGRALFRASVAADLGIEVVAVNDVGPLPTMVRLLCEPVTTRQVNEVFRRVALGPMPGILEVSDEPIVSSDVVGNPASCVADASLTMACGPLARVFGWYDNEWGWAHRLGELAALVGGTTEDAVKAGRIRSTRESERR